MQEEARYLKRKVKPGRIDVHPTDKAIVVHYEVEATILGDQGDAMLGNRKQCQKIIRVENLTKDNVHHLAGVIVEKCKMIHASKLGEVEQLLYYLDHRQTAANASSKSAGNNFSGDMQLDTKSSFEKTMEAQFTEKANVNDLDDYIELLYEDVGDKIRGTMLILQLARNPDNLEELVCNETMMGALSRVLREDGRGSIELMTNIIYIFFCFSSFSQFHAAVSLYQVGNMSMKLIEGEIKRTEIFVAGVERGRAAVIAKPNNVSFKEDLDKELRKMKAMMKKQEQLLYVAFHLLLNLAEDVNVEVKMKNRNIVQYLAAMLDRRNLELLVLVVTFLKKLSIFKENKDQMNAFEVPSKLVNLFSGNNDALLNKTMSLLFNLSFDKTSRSLMTTGGVIPRLVDLLENNIHRPLALSILYHLSMDVDNSNTIAYTDCVKLLLKNILEAPKGPVPKDIMALAINLSTNARCAPSFVDGNGLKFLMKRAIKARDPLLLNMARNICAHEGDIKLKFLDYIDDIMSLMKRNPDDEIVVEILGLLANLTIPDFDHLRLVEEYDLLRYITRKLNSDIADDIVLELVILIGTIATDVNCASLLAEENIIQQLIELLNAKQEDDEIVLQIIYVFYQMIFHEHTRNLMLNQTQSVAYLIDLMRDKNSEIRKMCDVTLDIIMEFDNEWARKIRHEKFRWHNAQWLDIVDMNREEGVPGSSDDRLYDDDGDGAGTDEEFHDGYGAAMLHGPEYYDDDDDDDDIH